MYSGCQPFTRSTFLNVFQVEILLRQDFVTGPVFFLAAGGLEPLGGQVGALGKLASQARGAAAAATQARLLEGFLKEKVSV